MILFQMDDLHLTFHLSSLTVLVFHLFLTHVCKGQSELIGSSQPIVATLGEDVVLPCHLQPAEDATDLTLEWTRPDLDPRFVYVWHSQQDLLGKKHDLFQGRTSLFIDELKKGNISLKLSKVKLSDEGHYRCFIPALEKETFVQLRVASAPVSSPAISLSGMDRDRGGVVLQCESAGWYPEPGVLWLDAEGNLLSAGPPETVRGPDDLYTVSSRVTVDKRHNNSFTCRVQQNNINQTREAHIHVPDDFFLSSSSSAVPINTGLAVSLAVSIMVILAGVFFVWRQNTTKTKKRSRDEAERGEKLLTEETVKINFCGRRKKKNKDLTEKYEKIEEELQKTEEELKNKTEELDKLMGDNKNPEEEKQQPQKIKDEEISQEESDLKCREIIEELKRELDTKAVKLEQTQRHVDDLRTENEKLKDDMWLLQEEKKGLEMIKDGLTNHIVKEVKDIEEWEKKFKEENTKREMAEKELKALRKNLNIKNSSSSDSQETSGDITVVVDQDYKYICLRNMSDQDKPLARRQLKVQINTGKPITYTFDQSMEVKAGKSVTLWCKGCGRHNPSTGDLVWKDLKSWKSGDRVQVTLQ